MAPVGNKRAPFASIKIEAFMLKRGRCAFELFPADRKAARSCPTLAADGRHAATYLVVASYRTGELNGVISWAWPGTAGRFADASRIEWTRSAGAPRSQLLIAAISAMIRHFVLSGG
jgi:hypothetical protein